MLYRRGQGLDLTSTHKVAIAQPVVDHEAEYDSVLVPMASDLYDESVVATAAKLAARRRRGIHVLALVTVPSSAGDRRRRCPRRRTPRESIIEQARVQAGARVSGHVERVRSGQAGRRIIEEAVDMRAAAIVMPLPRRVNGASLFGKTLETVLAERPCRVIIESAPAPERARAAGAREGGSRMRGRVLPALMVADRDRADRPHAGRGRRRRRHRAGARRPVHRRRRRALLRGAQALMQRPGPLKKQLGSPALFGIVQGFIAASIYFSTGLVAERALGLTWAVFLAGGVLFAVIVPCYVEGASLHQERGGATVIARYAFNELVSFIAGWAICLDYLILVALCAFASTDYLGVFWTGFNDGLSEFLIASAIVLYVALVAIRGGGPRRFERAAILVLGDLVLQLLIVILGLALLFQPEVLTDPASIAGSPSLEDMVFAFPLVLVAFSGIDASSGLAGQVTIGRAGLRRLIGVRLIAAMVPYLGIALVASSVLPQTGSTLGRGAAAGRRRLLRAGVAARAAEVPGRDLGGRDPRQRRPGGHARALTARLRAGRQPPDPVAAGLAAPHARDPGRDHRLRRGHRDLPADPGRSRVPGRDLRLRGDDRVHDRRPVGRAAALQGARPRPAVQDAAQRPLPRRRAAGLRRAVRASCRRSPSSR